MRITSKLFGLMLMLALFVFQACNKDDEPPVPNNALVIEGTEHELTKGIFTFFGKLDPSWTGWNYDMYLYSGTLNIDPLTGQVTGQGNIIFFEMFSGTSSELASGEYTFSSSAGIANTFDAGLFAINLNGADGLADDVGEVNGGKVTLTKNGTSYDVTIDITTVDGRQVTGFFRGVLEQI